MCVETTQMSALATEDMSAVETGQMSAAETGQMSAVETRQMSSVARTDICPVSTHNVDVSEVSIVAMSQCSSLRKSVRPQITKNNPNTSMFKSQTQYHNVQVPEFSIAPISPCRSPSSLNCLNVTKFKSLIVVLALN